MYNTGVSGGREKQSYEDSAHLSSADILRVVLLLLRYGPSESTTFQVSGFILNAPYLLIPPLPD